MSVSKEALETGSTVSHGGSTHSQISAPLSRISPQTSPSEKASSSDSPYLDSEVPKSHEGMPFNDFVIEKDDLHDYEAQNPVKRHMDPRVILDLTTMSIVIAGIVTLFLGYPVIHFGSLARGNRASQSLGGTNASGQVPTFQNMRMSLVDPDTPQEFRTKSSVDGSQQMQLVFSDEFNTDGRSFYPGNDPFWTAVDLWPWATGDYEWYSPEAVTTQGGNLVITADQVETNNLNFRSGQLTTWNQFCFTGGYIEVRLQLPGSSSVSGWWPAVWTMGNLGRANYGATTQGTWPYAYDACDVGTLRNQTYPDGSGPVGALTSGNTVYNRKYDTSSISWQPGQRLSACTCAGEDHPGPTDSSGNYVGRSAPEIDVIEAQVGNGIGGVSQSGQWMPANYRYELINTTGTEYEFFQSSAQLNSYQGNVLQQSASGVVDTLQTAYQYSGGDFSVYGFEYKTGYDGYINWISNGQRSWSLNSGALAADPRVNISRRPVPQEPMYILINLAISSGFGNIDWENLQFPGKMLVDYVRVYQPEGQTNIGCDPDDFPTQAYINKHIEAYTNPNLTVWGETAEQGGYQQDWPRNRLYPDGCENPPSKSPGPNPAA
ncbi:related to KRE6 - glucan synthase subunit [Melanopsichium pennsylvanicum]|uniref:Related to KRE6 - glucan synthase subunit n=2 Tax=Melanopsichium pennsylvanicum TaxID=63383 RepID=A0AAJ5C7V9_9BASI|nr:related to KRE6-glucan synthase subunit [Melanopsichium pennsylvanicum 4]SNX87331.1 related to KRE6 - glucan synthase subunit [Melanopsichium pennsylvanicum]